MAKIKTTTTTTVEVTPKQLAEIFWEMDDDEQAEFFQQLFVVSGLPNLDNQMYAVSKSATEYALRTMYTIGKYGEE